MMNRTHTHTLIAAFAVAVVLSLGAAADAAMVVGLDFDNASNRAQNDGSGGDATITGAGANLTFTYDATRDSDVAVFPNGSSASYIAFGTSTGDFSAGWSIATWNKEPVGANANLILDTTSAALKKTAGGTTVNEIYFGTTNSSGLSRIAYADSRIGSGGGSWYRDGTITPDLRDATWHHLAWVYDKTGVFRMYIDATMVYEKTDALTTLDPILEYFLGGHSPYKGSVDEFRMYDQVLTGDEVTLLKNTGDIIPEPATMSLLLIGGLGALLKKRRRRREA